MIYKSIYAFIAFCICITISAKAQNAQIELSFEQSIDLLKSNNKNIKIAQKEIEFAKA